MAPNADRRVKKLVAVLLGGTLAAAATAKEEPLLEFGLGLDALNPGNYLALADTIPFLDQEFRDGPLGVRT